MTTIETRKELANARQARYEYLTDRIYQLYSYGKKPAQIAKKLGITESRVRYYMKKEGLLA